MKQQSKNYLNTSRPYSEELATASFYCRHIINPCELPIGENIRPFYLRLAKKAVRTMKDEAAISLLEQAVRLYDK